MVRNKDAVLQDYSAFVLTFSSIFGEPERERNAERLISVIRQGKDSAMDYAGKFQAIARDVPWNERALIYRFLDGLAEHLQREIACKDAPNSLQEAIILAVRLDNLVFLRPSFQREPELPSRQPNSNTYQSKPAYPPPEYPMRPPSETQSKEEKHQERAVSGVCFYCGKPGHFIGICKSRIRALEGNGGAQSQH